MMKKLELLLCITVMVALLLKFLHLPFSAILLVLSVSSLAALYMGFGVAIFSNTPIRLSDLGSVNAPTAPPALQRTRFIGYAMGLVLVGVLFKLQHWPMANMQLKVGLAALVGLFILFFFRALKAERSLSKGLIIRTLTITLIGTCALFLP